MPLPRPAAMALAAAAALVLVAVVALPLDLDRDADSTWRELRSGTPPWLGDGDGDLLEDGWERRHGLDPTRADSDGDDVRDDAELRLGSDPRLGDSDRDGIPDRAEASLPDCDGDGVRAIAQGDGDADGRLDALEASGLRCTADADGDGVLDGAEGNAICVRRADCDGDGVPDAEETGGFSALDPDSFASGVSDAVTLAFRAAGQHPGADADGDGIPDGWEGSDGLIAWGSLRPRPGQRDLLVEYVRVHGPDSGRYGTYSFTPAYEAVAEAVLQERGLQLRWVETVVDLEQEPRPEVVPQYEDAYYAEVLGRSRHATNPYVTTVVLNPQHDQSGFVHAGVAPIRGMLAAIDYGAHMVLRFADGNGTQVNLRPITESLIRGGQQEVLAGQGFRGGYTQAGDMGLEDLDTGEQVLWQPSWFRSAPRVVADGEVTQLRRVGVDVEHAALAHTILHELGHTLGLCHAHEPSCFHAFTPVDQARRDRSTMSYNAPSGALHFLDSEWDTALEYLACPPEGPLTALAEGRPDEVLPGKYGYANRNLTAVDVRQCQEFTALAHEFEAGDPPASRYEPPSSHGRPADDAAGPGGAIAYAVAAAGVAFAAAWVVAIRRPRP